MTEQIHIQARNLYKSYPEKKEYAIENVSFSVKRGEIFGLIGADGAGKTTLFRLLTTLLDADQGEATVLGWDIKREYLNIRQQIGYMPSKFSLYQDLTITENLNFYATLFGTTIEENFHLIKEIYQQIAPFKDRKAGNLSGGMKQKLALCCALIHKPRLLFLDEPTTGIDPVSRKELWEMLQKLKTSAISILVSTPYMDEAILCDRIALIKEGKILSTNTPKGMIDSFDKNLYEIHTTQTYQTLTKLQKLPNIFRAYPFGDTIHAVTTQKNSLNISETKDKYITHITPIKPTIEDCFIDVSTHPDI